MSLRRFLAAPLLVVLAACTSATTPTPGAATPSAASASASASTEATASASGSGGGMEIEAEDSDLGTILVDADGNTIYFFDKDEEGVSNCSADCRSNWPPVALEGEPEAGSGVSADLGALDRAGGNPQLTVNGFPAYYFAGDSAPGDTNGQGVSDVWWVFGPDGDPIKE